jgi:hypothetical protein
MLSQSKVLSAGSQIYDASCSRTTRGRFGAVSVSLIYLARSTATRTLFDQGSTAFPARQ